MGSQQTVLLTWAATINAHDTWAGLWFLAIVVVVLMGAFGLMWLCMRWAANRHMDKLRARLDVGKENTRPGQRRVTGA